MTKSTQTSPPRISRRAVLRGAGVAVALPWLESLPVFGDATTPTVFPKRFGVVFMGNGINEKPTKPVPPPDPRKQKTNVIDALYNRPAPGHGIHPPQTGSLLSGAEIQ